MKQLLTLLAIVSLSHVAFASKQSKKDQSRPVRLECKSFSLEKGKDGKPDQIEAIEGSDFKMELTRQGTKKNPKNNNYKGAAKVMLGEGKSQEASASVTDLGAHNVIKVAVKRFTEGEVTQSGFADNTTDTKDPGVDVIMSNREILACDLIEKIYK